MVGQILEERYQVQEILGRGGMGVVYRGRDLKLDRPVVIKAVRPELAADAEALARFQREATAAAKLTHPHIVAVYDAHLSGEPYYIVQEYVEGGNLLTRLRQGPLPLAEALRLAQEVCEALEYAHAHGVVHRDVKPGNILLTPDGQAKLTDFGIAHAFSAPQLTATGEVLGSAHYLSPEQAQGKPVDARSDVYSLGVVLYEMLTGRVPFEGDTPVAVGYKHLTEPPPPVRAHRPQVPPAVEQAVLRALAKDPEKRYPSAAALKAALQAAQEGQTPETEDDATRLVSPPPAADRTRVLPARKEKYSRSPTPPRRSSALAFAGGSLLGLVLAGLALAWFFGFGFGEIVVPDVTGEQVAIARRELEKLGLTLTVVEQRYDERVPGGHIIFQRPRPKWRVRKGQTVQVIESKGPRFITVPDLTGLTPDRAQIVLAKTGLLLGKQHEAQDPAHPDGRIVAQAPPAGRKVEKSSPVDIFVNHLPAPPPEPTEEGEPAEGGLFDRLSEAARRKAAEAAEEAAEALREEAQRRLEEAKRSLWERMEEEAGRLRPRLPWSQEEEPPPAPPQ